MKHFDRVWLGFILVCVIASTYIEFKKLEELRSINEQLSYIKSDLNNETR